MPKDKLTKLLGIKYPIIQGGMAGISESMLAAAVSNAGGLGVIGSGFASPQWLKDEIEKTRLLTGKPFGVNFLMQNPKVADLVKIAIERKVPVVFTGGGDPSSAISRLKKTGVKIIPVVPSVRLAVKMEKAGADAVVVEGLESGGHIGENTTMCLVPQAANVIKEIPIIAAGGICDRKTFIAALVLGADGVQMGTRFLASRECRIHENYKKAVINASDEDVIVVARSTKHPLRLIKNKFASRIDKMEKKFNLKTDRFSGALVVNGNTDISPLLCGICAGNIRQIETCDEIIKEIVGEPNWNPEYVDKFIMDCQKTVSN